MIPSSVIIAWLSRSPVFVVPYAAVAPQPRFLLSIASLVAPEPRSVRSKVGHEGVGGGVVDTGQVPGVARGGAGHAGAVGISPGLRGLEIAVVEASVLEKSPVIIGNN